MGADAFQIYAGLPLLTAQPAAVELARIPHHLVGVVPPAESFDAHRYAGLARTHLDDILARGKTALVVGGTGLYFRALFEGFSAPAPASAELRAELTSMPLPDLVARLGRADPDALAQIDAQNPRRVLRAIEIVETTGIPLRASREAPRHPWPTGLLLTRDRDDLRTRIAANVATMLDDGAVEEVRQFEPTIGPTASRAIGFAEIAAHLRGEMSLAEVETAVVTATRQYAKRQLTWFRNQTTFRSLDLTGTSHPSQAAESALHALDLA